jgi:hypothetical protein
VTPLELMTTVRRWLNDEVIATYKWTLGELVDYFNNSIDQIARDTDYFTDPYTPLLTELTIAAGTGDYAFDPRMLEIVSAQIAGDNFYLTRASQRERVVNLTPWRFDAAVSGIDLAINAGTIASTTTDFLEAGLTAGKFIQISGSATAGNNKSVEIETVAQYLLTLASGYTLTPRVAGDRVVLRQLITGTPLRYMTDYRQGYLTLDPIPDKSGTLIMSVLKLQDVPLTEALVATPGTYVIPINYQYHLQLADGICAKSYMKSGPSTFNIEKSRIHQADFEKLKDRIKRDMIKRDKSEDRITPHDGAI